MTAPSEARRYLSCSVLENGVIIDRLPYMAFEAGSARITAQAAATLDGFVADYDAPPHCEIVIEGHADRSGSSARNIRLSGQRAEAVAAYLRSKGITAPLVIMQNGEARPLVETPDGVAERQNRYVSIWILDPISSPR
ncbi:MAG TPA: OmpA family protein [Allosphingosinicella sp.]|nr:OmpA family protein [Allosphingosinicella sp.]